MKEFVVFFNPGPSKFVPATLYYVDGHTWEDDRNKATLFTHEEAELVCKGHDNWMIEKK